MFFVSIVAKSEYDISSQTQDNAMVDAYNKLADGQFKLSQILKTRQEMWGKKRYLYDAFALRDVCAAEARNEARRIQASEQRVQVSITCCHLLIC